MISRDDLIAHLMLGFWVVRVPEGLRGSGLEAAPYLDAAEETITTALDPLVERLMADLERLRHESRVCRAQRRA